MHKRAAHLRQVSGGKAKREHKARYQEKVEMRKKIKAHEEKQSSTKKAETGPKHAVPAFLMDRENVDRAKIMSNTIKQKRKEKAGKWDVPIPKVKAMSEDQMFSVVKSGKRMNSQWYDTQEFLSAPASRRRFSLSNMHLLLSTTVFF